MSEATATFFAMVLSLVGPTPKKVPAALQLKAGDTIVAIGDSITAGGRNRPLRPEASRSSRSADTSCGAGQQWKPSGRRSAGAAPPSESVHSDKHSAGNVDQA